MFDIHVDLPKKREAELTALFTNLNARNIVAMKHDRCETMTVNATMPDEASIGTLVIKGFKTAPGRASVDFGV